MRTAFAACIPLSFGACGGGVISSEDVSGGEAVAIAVVILIGFVFIGAVITRRK